MENGKVNAKKNQFWHNFLCVHVIYFLFIYLFEDD